MKFEVKLQLQNGEKTSVQTQNAEDMLKFMGMWLGFRVVKLTDPQMELPL